MKPVGVWLQSSATACACSRVARNRTSGAAFLRQLQVDPRRREVDQLAGGVEREVHRVLVAELLELLRVVAADPARGRDAAPCSKLQSTPYSSFSR